MTLIPAYGRDYKSKAAVLADFDAGKDFDVADLFCGGRGYVTKEELIQDGERSVNIRYDKLRKVCVVKLPGRSDT